MATMKKTKKYQKALQLFARERLVAILFADSSHLIFCRKVEKL